MPTTPTKLHGNRLEHTQCKANTGRKPGVFLFNDGAEQG